MKKIFTTLAFVALATSFASQLGYAETLEPTTVDKSACLNTRSEYDDIKWSIDYNDGILTVFWKNFYANCCPDFTYNAVRKGNVLNFYVIDNFGMCNCMCPYDISTTFNSIEPGHYTISFNTEYGELFKTEVDISNGCSMLLSADTTGIKTVKSPEGLINISSDGILYVNTENEVKIEIFDAAGTLQYALNASAPTSIDIKTLAKGYYIVKASAGQQQIANLKFLR